MFPRASWNCVLSRRGDPATSSASSSPPPRHYDRGYGRLFLDHVTQANLGCDFDFLMP